MALNKEELKELRKLTAEAVLQSETAKSILTAVLTGQMTEAEGATQMALRPRTDLAQRINQLRRKAGV